MTDVLVLAGRRDGTADPLAVAFGVSHKCMVPVGGKPLIRHVLDAVAGWDGVGTILVSIDDPAVLASQPWVAERAAQGTLKLLTAETALTGSIMAAAAEASFPLIITTADNVLLTSDALAALAGRSSGDATVAVARRENVLAAHPEGQRRFYRFADGAFSNCNLYWVASREALAASRAFQGGGQFAKHPMRILAAFGFLNLIRFKLRRLSLAAMMSRLSKTFGLSIRAVEMEDGFLAIDVDNERTHRIAGELLAARG